MRRKNISVPTISFRVFLIAAIAVLTLFAGERIAICAEELGILQNIRRGEMLPSIELSTIKDPAPQTFTPGKGKPAVVMFFSVRPDFRKQRSLALLSTLSDLANQYKSRLDVVAVFSDSEELATVKKYMENSSLHVMVFNDSQKRIYNAYGVFMMPLVVLSDKEGKLHEVIPYTYNVREIVEANIKYLLGELDRDKLVSALAPKKNIDMSAEEKEYIRRVNYGRVMHSKKMYGQAIREFSNAVKLMPGSVEAHIGLGWALLKTLKYNEAEASFKKALTINTQSDEAIGGLGLVYYGRREIDAALIELEKAIIASDPHLEVIITLADIYEQKGQYDKANRLNKLAVSILMSLYEQRWK